MKKDYLYTLISQMVVLITFVLSYKFIASLYGNVAFEDFSLIKRDVTFFIAVVGLGLYTALIKYISHKKNQLVFFKSGFLFGVGLFFILFMLLLLSMHKIPIEDKYKHMLLPALVMSSGIYFHNIVYAYLRGMSLIKVVNFFDILNKAGAPFFALAVSSSLPTFFVWHGVYQIVNATILFLYLNQWNIKIKYDEFLISMRTLLKYGIKRIGADFGINILLILPILFSESFYAGKIAFGITLLTVVGYLYSPLGNLLLPRLSKSIHDNNLKLSNKYIVYSVFSTLFSSTIIMFFAILLKDVIVRFFLDSPSEDMLTIISYLLLSIIPFVVYLVGKNIIDAHYHSGINSQNIFLSIAIYFFVYFIMNHFGYGANSSDVVLPFVVSIYLLGTSTFFYIALIWKRYKT